MTAAEDIADLIERTVSGDPWHGSSTARLLDSVTAEQAARPGHAGSHSIWQIVVHMTGWTREVTARLQGASAGEPEQGDWPGIGEPTAERWRAAQAALFAAHRDLAAALRTGKAADLSQPVTDTRDPAAGTGLSHFLTLHGLIHHTVYHSGQIALLKRQMS